MNPPIDDFYLWEFRTDLELDQDLIVGTDGYLFLNSLPPDWQIEKMKELPGKLEQGIKQLQAYEADAGNKEYKQRLIDLIKDLKEEAESLIVKLSNARF